MQLSEVTVDDFSRWLEYREKLYGGLGPSFHRIEMDLIHASPEATAFLCVTDQGACAGLLEVSLRNFVDGCLGGPVGYIEGLYLDPEFRGMGLGRKVVEFAAEWFREQGCHDMATDAEQDNLHAQAFFAHIGFTETFRIVEFRRSLGLPHAEPDSDDTADGR